MSIEQLLIVMWILVGVAGAANVWHARTNPPRWVEMAVIGLSATGIALLVGFIAIMCVIYDAALLGLGLALIIVAVAATIWWAWGTGYRPALPRLSLPLKMAWPQARYARRFASQAEAITWEVEEVE